MEKGGENNLSSSEHFHEHPEIDRDYVIRYTIENIERGRIERIYDIKFFENANIKILDLPEVKEVLRLRIIEDLRQGGHHETDEIFKLKEKFQINDEFMSSPELQKAAVETIKRNLGHGYNIDGIIKIKNGFHINDEIIKSLEFQKAAIRGIKNNIEQGYIESATKLTANFLLAEKLPQEDIVASMLYGFSRGDLSPDKLLKIKDTFSIDTEIIHSPEFQKAAIEAITNEISNCHNNNFSKIIEIFSIPQEVVQKNITNVMSRRLVFSLTHNDPYYDYQESSIKEKIDDFIKIKEQFSVPEEVVQKAILNGITKNIFNAHIYEALQIVMGIKEKISVSEDIIKSPEVQKAAKKVIIASLSNDSFDRDSLDFALEIKNEFLIREGEIMKIPKIREALVR